MLPRITDYWDQQVDAVQRLSQVLAEVPEAERPAQVQLIASAVTRHADALDDKLLTLSAVPIVEDLYKAALQLTSLDRRLLEYLDASAGPYFRALTRRGYMVRYFIDNTFSILDGPVSAFPIWFPAASLFYICPQEIAAASVSKYIVDAREVADRLAERCNAAGRHFVYLETDTDGFEAAFKSRGEPGVITVIRAEAPIEGSRCVVDMPPGARSAGPSASSTPAT